MGASSHAVAQGQSLRFDAVVVGAGVAGLVAALKLLEAAPRLSVAIIDKGAPGSSGSTPLAQGGMAAAVGEGDSPALHASDTIAAGDGLCDPYAAAVMAAEGPDRLADLRRWGAVFDTDQATGAYLLAREGGQSVARSARAADATGAEIFRALRARAAGRITRLQGIACALAQHDAQGPEPGRVAGVWVLLDDVDHSALGPAQEAGLALVEAGATLLATGGAGGLFAATTNPDGACADGLALAYSAGAELTDLEFVQFHPTGLRPPSDRPGFQRFLLTEALRGAGALLVDGDGRRFMPERHPDAELAPRHVVTKAILDQPGGAWLDATRLSPERLAEEFPTVLAGVSSYGYDLGSDPVPVEPCEHYMIGGVATDLRGRTTVAGLWAAGEVACTGVHGANRMAGNSLLQSCVFAHHAARDMAASLRPPGPADVAAPQFGAPEDGSDLAGLRASFRLAFSAGAGAIRTAASLETAAKAVESTGAALPGLGAADRAGVELRDMVEVGRLIVRSAALRTESRGTHWREDFPGRRQQWAGVRLRVRG